MKRNQVWASLVALGIVVTGSSGVFAQDSLPTASPIEKTLADRATHVTEVTLDKNMLAFAAKFMGKDKDKDKDGDRDDEAVKQMIQNLKGVYVRDYEFDKDHSYTAEELEGLRKYIQGTEWSPMVHERTKGAAEGTDIYLKLVDGQVQGLFVLDAEPKELALVLILGPVDMDKIGSLGGNFGIPKDAVKSVKKAQKEAGK
ncbi:DUF4252 domain-containing protein [Acidicapsa acidisoli]|uniref:DUF4252 domain-containing protein n=1 Tax=Acidicapsa acidisoli TaxID=1615681 RepID=UPI0021E028F4|nr:DUF4252 domain-containing protein [Acidicapsa acidisoli]